MMGERLYQSLSTGTLGSIATAHSLANGYDIGIFGYRKLFNSESASSIYTYIVTRLCDSSLEGIRELLAYKRTSREKR